MKNINSSEINFEKKIVLLRLDLNVPLEGGKITDTNRIDKIIPTLNFLIQKKAHIIIISHVGRPKGKVVKELSLEPICKNLSKKINKNINLIKSDPKKINKKELFSGTDNNIAMLENIRFYKEEEEDESVFAQSIASLGDIYVNDAFSCSHRKHASVFSITKFLPSFAGLQLSLELNALEKITKKIEKPITCIIGGSKISTKINIINNLIPKFDNMIIVGGMANNILKYKKYPIGKSINEEGCDSIIDQIFYHSKKVNCKIIYPSDVCVGKNLEDSSTIKNLDEVLDDDLILDIGPKTIKHIQDIIDKSKTILWNGPAGYFENTNFSKGSLEIAKKISKKNELNEIFSVAGGGDTVASLNNFGLTNNFNFVSTAGGAFLEFLEGKELPGIKALNYYV